MSLCGTGFELSSAREDFDKLVVGGLPNQAVVEAQFLAVKTHGHMLQRTTLNPFRKLKSLTAHASLVPIDQTQRQLGF